MGKIDSIDMRILTELVKDSSVSVPKLSKKISTNPSVVYSRIKRMVKRGLIKHYTLEVNEEQLGYNVRAYVGVNIDSKQRDELLEEMSHLNEVRRIIEITGRFDLLLEVHARGLTDLHEFISRKLEPHRNLHRNG